MDLKNRWVDFLLPLGIVACLLVIFMPLPPSVMDILLAANITIGVVVLLSTVYVKTPLELSIFPSLLLATTLARLALNIGTTRLILTRGAIDHEQAAGGVILGFSQFVTGDNIAVGLVIFSIIVVVQFVVITKGATRISEVAARFALDGLPGRQMAIDAELSSGVIDNHQAQSKRAELVEHADFYGAMDGASKFVRGDAIAGVIITLINIVGGLAIGMSNGMSVAEAADTFTKLTIGDGLVSQFPALLISLAAGLLVTRSTRKTNLPQESLQQVFARPIVMVMAAVFLSLLILTELPKLPLALIAGCCLMVAWSFHSRPASTKSSATPSPAPQPVQSNTTPSLEKLLNNAIMEIELGAGLIRIADVNQGGQLLALVGQVRQQIAQELGVVLPKLRIGDNLNLPAEMFQIRIQGNVVLRGEIQPEANLAMDSGQATEPMPSGTVLGMPMDGMFEETAFWIRPTATESAKNSGYQVFAPDQVLAQLLKRVSLSYAPEILTRDATQELIDEVRNSSPAVIDELIPNMMTLGQVQQVLKSLLDENVSIRPLALILETLGDNVGFTDNRWELVEKVRVRLGRHITSSIADSALGKLRVVTLEDILQDRIACAWERRGNEIHIGMPRDVVEHVAVAIQVSAARMVASGYRPVIMVDQTIRPVIAELAHESNPRPVVVGSREVNGASVDIEVIDQIGADPIRTAA